MMRKKTIMIGPKKAATRAVPWLCTQNSVTRMKMVIGMTNSLKRCVTSSRPSIADITEIAGVMIASPEKSAAPRDAEQKDRRRRAASADLRQRHQRQNAAFAAVVGAHQEDDVFDRNGENQGENRAARWRR